MRNLIAILRGIHPDEVVSHAEAILEAGITVLEVPLNSPQPFDSIARLAHRFGDHGKIGAGTVLTVAEVERLSGIGAALIVSPNTDVRVIGATRAAGMESWPGVMTPSECFTALEAGASGLKLFPASLIGPSGLSAMRAVLPVGTPLYAVGGAGPENFVTWLAAGALGFGIGSALYRPGQDVAATRAAARHIVAAYDEAAHQGNE